MVSFVISSTFITGHVRIANNKPSRSPEGVRCSDASAGAKFFTMRAIFYYTKKDSFDKFVYAVRDDLKFPTRSKEWREMENKMDRGEIHGGGWMTGATDAIFLNWDALIPEVTMEQFNSLLPGESIDLPHGFELYRYSEDNADDDFFQIVLIAPNGDELFVVQQNGDELLMTEI